MGVRTLGLKRKGENPLWRVCLKGREERGRGLYVTFKNKNFITLEGVPNKSRQNHATLSLLSQKGILWMTLGLKFLQQELLQVYAECQCIKLLIKSWVSFQMMEQGEEMLFFGAGGRREVSVGV